MRKGYGPTGVSYHYPMSTFIDDISQSTEPQRRRIYDTDGVDISGTLQHWLHNKPERLQQVYNDADCVEYRDDKFTLVASDHIPRGDHTFDDSDYVESGGLLCPYCGSHRIETFDHPEVSEGQITTIVKCDDCDNKWGEWYELTNVVQL